MHTANDAKADTKEEVDEIQVPFVDAEFGIKRCSQHVRRVHCPLDVAERFIAIRQDKPPETGTNVFRDIELVAIFKSTLVAIFLLSRGN